MSPHRQDYDSQIACVCRLPPPSEKRILGTNFRIRVSCESSKGSRGWYYGILLLSLPDSWNSLYHAIEHRDVEHIEHILFPLYQPSRWKHVSHLEWVGSYLQELKGQAETGGEQIPWEGEAAAPVPAHMLLLVWGAGSYAPPGHRWRQARSRTCHHEAWNRRPEPLRNCRAGCLLSFFSKLV